MSNRRRLARPPGGKTGGCPACGGRSEVIRWRGQRRVTYVHQPGCPGISGAKPARST